MVRFRFKELLVESTYKSTADVQRAEDEISNDLAQVCAKQLRVWKYRPGNDSGQPTLNVWLKSVGANFQVVMTLFVPRGEPRMPEWKGDLLVPGESEVRGASRPHKPEYESMIVTAFENRLLTVNFDSIFSALSSQVTIGTGLSLVKTPSATAKAVLGLDWGRYCRDFANSDYLISAESKDGTRVELDSRGLPGSLSYTPEQPRFLGIGVRLNVWRAGSYREGSLTRHRNELAELRPLSFKMKNYRDFDEPCAVEKTPRPAVAPVQ